MEQQAKSRNFGPLYLVFAALCWSTAGVLTKYIPFSAMSVACIRGIIAAVMQLIYVRLLHRRAHTSPDPLKSWLTRPILLTALCYVGESSLFMFANKMTSAGSAIVLQNTSPLYIILMGLLVLRQKPSRLDCCVGAVIFSGIVLSMVDTFRGGALPGSNPMLGNLLALASGVFYAGIFFTSRLPGADPLKSAILGNCLYLFFLPFVLTDPVVRDPAAAGASPLAAWGAMLFMGVFQFGLSWICFSRGIERTPSLQASFITMIEPVLNPILAFFLLHEAMGTLSVIGSVLVIATIIVHNVLTAKAEQKNAA